MKILRTILVAMAATLSFTTMVMSQERLSISALPNTTNSYSLGVQNRTMDICTGDCMVARPPLYTAQLSTPSTTIVTPPASSGTDTGVKTTVTTVQTSAWATYLLDWIWVAFGTTIGTGVTALIVRGLNLLGIQVNAANKAQLQALIVNGINAGYAKAKAQASTLPPLELKGKVSAYAVEYVQSHGEKIIKATGLDPKDGDVVEALRARVETALNDPATPTPAEITPKSGQPPQVNGVIIQGERVA